jgi:cytochrome c-type biogenesis protein
VILTLGANEGTALRGGLLAAAYALGLGVPFIIAGVAYERMLGAVRFIRRHQVWVTRFGGVLMIALGVALITGWWDVLVNWLQVSLIASYQVGV